MRGVQVGRRERVRWPAVGALLTALLLLPGASPSQADEADRRWPLGGTPEVSRDFAPPQTRYAAGHRGVDLPSAPGAPVLAAAAGRVTYAGLLAGRGVVVVSHGALRTTYEPVTAGVPVGALVDAGAVLGHLEAGHQGCPVRACLHWGLKRGPDYLDPARWVAGGPVRLLPVDGARAGAGPGLVAGAAGSGPVPATVPPRRQVGATVLDGPRTGEPALPDRGDSAASAEAAAESTPAERTASDPSWSLRSAEAPLGAAAVAALVAGIGLLARPRPPSPEPVSGGAATPVPVPADEDVGPPGELVDLDAARARRRSG